MRRVLLCLGLAGCSEGGSSTVTALHDLHQPSAVVTQPTAAEDFYRLPFPNPMHLKADGKLDLTTYPHGVAGGVVETYLNTFEASIEGAATQGGLFFRFDGAIDPASLPADPNASVQAGATAYVVDVTPGSPTYGKQTPVFAHFVPDRYDYIGPNWLCLLPVPGFPLREKTTYVAILTDGIHCAQGTQPTDAKCRAGSSIKRDEDFDAVMKGLSSDAAIARTASPYKPLTDWLQTQAGLAAHVMNATVFTTLDATSIMPRLRTAVLATPAPTLVGLTYAGEDSPSVDDLYTGMYVTPNFQVGSAPYMTSGGQIVLDSSGAPQLNRMETLRVAMTIPKGATMPQAGWPVVLYAHGTGGDWQSFVNDGSGREAAKITDAQNNVIARMAMVSIDLVNNGARVPFGTNVDLAFVNVNNIVAASASLKQGGADYFQLLRLVEGIDIASAPTTGAPIKFDVSHIYYKGHSEGSSVGPLFLAAEPKVRAAILSGAGAGLIQGMLGKHKPIDIPTVLAGFLNDPIDQYHPLFTLMQNYLEDSDPGNYAVRFFREPPTGQAPKSIYMSIGITDNYTPFQTAQALLLAGGMQPVMPSIEELPLLPVGGVHWVAAPQMGNVAGGAATAVALEYNQAPGSDGHFVVFDIPAAIAQSSRFLATDFVSGLAQLTSP
jgi:hypothetical protein